MKLSKMPGFGSYGIIVDDFDWADPNSYIELKKINLENLVTVVKGHGKNNFNNLSIHAYNTFVPRSGAFRWALKYGLNWYSQSEENERKSFEALSSWTAGLDVDYPGWGRVSGVKDANGKAIGAFDTTELLWHQDDPGSIVFYPLVVLYGAAHMNTSATCFVQTADWYETQSESFRSELDELIAVYDTSRIQYNFDPENRDITETNQLTEGFKTIPLTVISPGGKKGIRFSRQISKFEGMSESDSEKIIQKINTEIFDLKYNYDFWWEHDQGDLVLIDNSITLHQRKIRHDLDMRTELSQRIAYRAIADYTDMYDYSPFIKEYYNNLRHERINYVNDLNQLSTTHWAKHLPLLRKLSRVERLNYINCNVKNIDKTKLLKELRNMQ